MVIALDLFYSSSVTNYSLLFYAHVKQNYQIVLLILQWSTVCAHTVSTIMYSKVYVANKKQISQVTASIKFVQVLTALWGQNTYAFNYLEDYRFLQFPLPLFPYKRNEDFSHTTICILISRRNCDPRSRSPRQQKWYY